MRRAVIAVAVLAALAVVPAAVAKEVTSVQACGADGCVTSRDPALLQGLTNGGGPGQPPRHPAGAVRLRSRVSEPGGKVIARYDVWWVPGTRRIVAEDGGWLTLPRDVVAVVQRVTRGLHPYGPQRLGASFAGTSAHAAAPPPTRPAAAGDDADGGIDWLLVGGLCALAAVAATGLALLRRRPGGATP